MSPLEIAVYCCLFTGSFSALVYLVLKQEKLH
jgi:hypothetical protein